MQVFSCCHVSVRPAGAPRPTRTFFCDADGISCYNHTAGLRVGFSAARAACQAQGGDLVRYTSGAKQKDVESYFSSRGTLAPDQYWHGIYRDAAGALVQFVDGNVVGESVSNQDPYAHWDQLYLKTASQPTFHCARRTSSPAVPRPTTSPTSSSDQGMMRPCICV